jgi:hypothetical protein
VLSDASVGCTIVWRFDSSLLASRVSTRMHEISFGSLFRGHDAPGGAFVFRMYRERQSLGLSVVADGHG